SAVLEGVGLIVADPRDIELSEIADVHLQQRPGSDVALVNAMMNVIIEENLADENFIAQRTENFEAAAAVIRECTPERASEITGVPAEDIVRAARLYASADRGSIYFAMGITQHHTGTDNVLSLANLAMLSGNVGREGTGVNPLRGQNNVQGACDMGALPNVLPGYQAVGDDELRRRFEEKWGTALPEDPGLTVVEMMQAAGDQIRAMYIMGENPMVSDPDQKHVEEALEKLDFLLVQDIFLTETAQYADVVLPAVSFAEKEGTFTNTERRIQRVRSAVSPPDSARQDWQIICELAEKMGYDMSNSHPAEVMREIASLTPIYGGISYDRIEDRGLQWPCPHADHPGTPYLHRDQFSRGLGRFHPVEYIPPAETPDAEYDFVLMTGRMLYHFHTGTMTRRSQAIDRHEPDGYVEMNLDDCERLGISEGDRVRITSRRGSVQTFVRAGRRVLPGHLFMPFHYAESAANRLTGTALDPVAKIPELKVSAVKVERAS
ncbi:MAG: molybdopterin-dependent oxidoreductase, partial [Bacillota bacterium]